ncbi:3288_t:CDS:2, partial [Funneliformis caledonium]
TGCEARSTDTGDGFVYVPSDQSDLGGENISWDNLESEERNEDITVSVYFY